MIHSDVPSTTRCPLWFHVIGPANQDYKRCDSSVHLPPRKHSETSAVNLDSIALDEFGSAVQFESDSGDTFDVDALAIKTLIDQDAAGRVATWVQRSDQRLAQQVRAARLKSGITQSDLGKRAGMDQAVISKLERGLHRPRIDTLQRIADALGLSMTDLLKATA